MKSKTNFTYKEFISKLSNVPTSAKNNISEKSPRVLKSCNRNTQVKDIDQSKLFFKKSLRKSINYDQNSFPIQQTKKVEIKQKQLNRKSNNQSKVNLKKQISIQRTSPISQIISKKIVQRHRKVIKQQQIRKSQNFSYIQSPFNKKHQQSCQTFNRNIESRQYNNSQNKNLNQPFNLKLKTKQQSVNNQNIKKCGNQTERTGGSRLTTNYQGQITHEDVFYKKQNRMMTQYNQKNSVQNVQDSSFFQGSQRFLQSCLDQPLFQSQLQPSSLINVQKSTIFNYNKFMTTITSILIKIVRIDEMGLLLQHQLKYIQYLECLKQFKMISADYEPYIKTEGLDLVRQMWQQLVGGKTVQHFILIVAIILKITPLQHVKSQSHYDLKNYVYIQNKFSDFRFKKLEQNSLKTFSEKQTIKYYNYPFRPQISDRSRQMAQKSRSKKKYIINPSRSEQNSNAKAQAARQNVSLNTEFDYSLLNDNNSKVVNSNMRSPSPIGSKRSEILYDQAKKRSKQKKQNKSTVDYEFERNQKQLTFKPQLLQKSIDITQRQYVSPRFQLDEQKTINRMIRARVEKEVKKLTVDKGLPYNQKLVDRIKKDKFQQIIDDQKVNKSTSKKSLKVRPNLTGNQSKPIKDNSQRQDPQKSEIVDLLDFTDEKAQQIFDQVELHLTSLTIQQPSESSIFMLESCASEPKELNTIDNTEQSPEDYFILDIFIEEDKCEKLLIRRDANCEQVVQQAESFVKKHGLPKEMQTKLKEELMLALKFYNLQKIEENDEDEECSLLV